MNPIITAVIGPIVDVIKRFVPDPDLANQLQTQITLALAEKSADVQKAAAEIIKTEASSSHWLAANWRPLAMVVFIALIVARWFGYSAPNLSQEEAIKLWSIVEISMGGYVVGRSVEKIVPAITESLANRNR